MVHALCVKVPAYPLQLTILSLKPVPEVPRSLRRAESIIISLTWVTNAMCITCVFLHKAIGAWDLSWLTESRGYHLAEREIFSGQSVRRLGVRSLVKLVKKFPSACSNPVAIRKRRKARQILLLTGATTCLHRTSVCSKLQDESRNSSISEGYRTAKVNFYSILFRAFFFVRERLMPDLTCVPSQSTGIPLQERTMLALGRTPTCTLFSYMMMDLGECS